MSNYHAQNSEGQNFRSKKALREAVLAGDVVYFTDTSLFDNQGTVRWENLKEGSIVVGPDPYRDRRWYANKKNGKLL